MAFLKISVVIAVICVLFQCVDSRSVLGSLRVNGFSKGKLGGKLNGLKGELSTKGLTEMSLPTIDVSGLKDKMTLPPLEVDKIKPSIRKPIFGGKLGKRDSLKEKLANIAGLKKSFLKKKFANIGSSKSLFSKVKLGNFSNTGKLSDKLNLKKIGKLGNGKFSKLGFKNRNIGSKLGSVFGRRLLPKLTLDGKLASTNLNIGSKGNKFGSMGLFKKTLRQRLADKLGLGNRFEFFDGRRGIFDRSGSIFGKNKKLNALDMLDGKLASLNSRFQKKIDRINKKIDRLNLSPLELSTLNKKFDGKLINVNGKIVNLGDKIGQFNRKLSIDIGKIKADKLSMKFNPIDELDGKLASLSSNGIINGNGRLFKKGKLDIKLNPLDVLDGKLSFLRSKLGLGKKLNIRPLFDGKLFNKKALKLNPIDLLDGKLANMKFGSGKLNLIDELDFKLANLKAKLQKPIKLGWNGKLDDVLPSLEEKITDVNGRVNSIVDSAFAGKVRNLENNSGETRFQRLWKRERNGKVANMLAAKLALKKRLFEKISKLGKGTSKFGGKFAQKLKARKQAKIARLADSKFAGKFPPIGKIRKINTDKLFKKTASTSTAAPVVTSTTTIAPATSTEKVVSSLKEKVSSLSDLSGISSDNIRNSVNSAMFDAIPGAHGILHVVNLLENGGSIKDATAALVERNDVDALKHLFESINTVSLAS